MASGCADTNHSFEAEVLLHKHSTQDELPWHIPTQQVQKLISAQDGTIICRLGTITQAVFKA